MRRKMDIAPGLSSDSLTSHSPSSDGLDSMNLPNSIRSNTGEVLAKALEHAVKVTGSVSPTQSLMSPRGSKMVFSEDIGLSNGVRLLFTGGVNASNDFMYENRPPRYQV